MITLSELKAYTGLRNDYLLNPWLRKGDLVMLYAQRGLSKTFLITKLAHSLGSAQSYFKWQSDRPFRSLHFSGEMGKAVSADRYEAVDRGSVDSVPGNNVCFLCYEDMTGGKAWNLASPADQHKFKEASKGFDVVILDNLLTLSEPVDKFDDDCKQWRRIVDLLLYWRKIGTTVVLVHHAGKSGDQLGTSQRENLMDVVVEVKKCNLIKYENGSSLEWHFTKARNFFGAATDPIHVSIQTQDGGVFFNCMPLEKLQREKVLEMWHDLHNQRIVAEVLGIPVHQVVSIVGESQKKEEVKKSCDLEGGADELPF